IFVDKLDTPYPPKSAHISEDPDVAAKWYDHIYKKKQADSRKKRWPIHELDPTKLQQTIPADESCKIVDANTGELLAVEVVSGDNTVGFIDWAIEAVKDGLRGRRSVRLEDPGTLVQTGYTAGSRSKPSFDWVRNLLWKRELTPEFLATADHHTSCLFAIFWNICRNHLPAEVIEPWVAYNAEHMLPRMDGGLRSDRDTGDVTIELGDDSVTFRNMELAPACGLLGQNYSRGVHSEKQPHPFAVQWLLSRNANDTAGAHFYLADYGIKIVHAPNTIIAWQPSHCHGTSLGDWHPDDAEPDFKQLGIAFVTPPRL
ncbi:hypothetical protein C8Q74DRAFT_1169340, partial [Fomes fomentarius]